MADTKSKRVQRSRRHKMPEGAVYVGRPTKWGNPFKIITDTFGAHHSVAIYRDMAQGVWNPATVELYSDEVVRVIYQLHQDWRKRIGEHPAEAIRRELRGKDLACWCKPGEPCHADVLLEIANESEAP